MNFVLEARHWVIMIGAVIMAAAAVIIAPQMVAIYPMTIYAVPILAAAVILDTLGTAAGRHRVALKGLAWVDMVHGRPRRPDAPKRRSQRHTGALPDLDRCELASSTRDLGSSITRDRCKCWINNPQECWRKIPTFRVRRSAGVLIFTSSFGRPSPAFRWERLMAA